MLEIAATENGEAEGILGYEERWCWRGGEEKFLQRVQVRNGSAPRDKRCDTASSLSSITHASFGIIGTNDSGVVRHRSGSIEARNADSNQIVTTITPALVPIFDRPRQLQQQLTNQRML
jgi:hypothetical protein